MDGNYLYHCGTHSSPHTISSNNRICVLAACTIISSFVVPCGKREYCVKHKPEEAEHLRWKCQFEGCKIQPSCGLIKRTHCGNHKTSEMKYFASKVCLEINCDKMATYGTEWRNPIHCINHKKENEKCVTLQRCISPECEKCPSYGYEDGKREYCSTHKKDGMINLSIKFCMFDGCKIEPSFGFVGQNAVYCKSHKEESMVDVVSKWCENENCRLLAT